MVNLFKSLEKYAYPVAGLHISPDTNCAYLKRFWHLFSQNRLFNKLHSFVYRFESSNTAY